MIVFDRITDLTNRDPLYAFAMDELLCKYTGAGGPAICHLWRHPRSFIMGLRDSRLPNAPKAKEWLESLGYAVAVRNSGGAAVPLDSGVVNISLILPKQGPGDTHFHQDFERMYQLIQQALLYTGCTVNKGEIQGAYCPGDYDLSIQGRKFCGIAQRRQAHAYVIQAFVVCEGSGSDRASLVRSFYQIAAGDSTLADYPYVVENSTASLSELTSLGQAAEPPADVFTRAVKQVILSQQDEAVLQELATKLILPDDQQLRDMILNLRTRYGLSS